MQFAYTAKAQDGQPAAGVLAADSLPNAQRQLRQQGLFVLSLTPARRGVAAGMAMPGRRKGLLGRFGRRARVSRKELLAFTSQLAIMSKAGIDVAGTIQSLQKQAASPRAADHARSRVSRRDRRQGVLRRVKQSRRGLRPGLRGQRRRGRGVRPLVGTSWGGWPRSSGTRSGCGPPAGLCSPIRPCSAWWPAW